MPRRILVVDGYGPHRRLLREILERAGYFVAEATSREDALEKVRVDPPDLVTTEALYPADGLELLLDLKRNRSTCDIPVVMVSAKAQDADILRAVEAGIGVYLTKPFNPLELVSFVTMALAKDGVDRGRFDLSHSLACK